MTPEQYRDDAILDAQRAQEAQAEESAFVGMVWLGDAPCRPCCGVPVVLPHEAGCPAVEPACAHCGELIEMVYAAHAGGGGNYWRHVVSRGEHCADGVRFAEPPADYYREKEAG